MDMGRRREILEEIADERFKQILKFGKQDRDSLDQVLLKRKGGCTEERMAEEYEIPSANRARFMCATRFERDNQGTWGHILVEEVAEAIGCLDDEEAMRQELIQVAAVALAWVECLDRKKEKNDGRD